MSEHNAVVAIYRLHTEAQAAMKALRLGAFNVTNLSIVGKDYHTDEHVVGHYNSGDRMKYWGTAITGIGPVLLAGPLLRRILSALEGATVIGGMTAIGAALSSVGIPRDSILNYETALKSSKFLLLAQGTVEEVDHARSILQTTRTYSIDTHATDDEAARAVA